MAKMTMKEIAKKAKVSQPTVSRVLNGHKGVSEDIVNSVMKVIEEVGYVPNKAAQTLKRSSTNIIGICIREIYNPYFVEIIDSLEHEARKNGYNILLHNSKFNPVTEWENIQNFVSRQVDGSRPARECLPALSTPTMLRERCFRRRISSSRPPRSEEGRRRLDARRTTASDHSFPAARRSRCAAVSRVSRSASRSRGGRQRPFCTTYSDPARAARRGRGRADSAAGSVAGRPLVGVRAHP